MTTDRVSSSENREPTPQDLVHQLDEALHGYTVARPVTPKRRWSDLLDEVSRLACTCPPDTPAHAYDCDVCAAQHRRATLCDNCGFEPGCERHDCMDVVIGGDGFGSRTR